MKTKPVMLFKLVFALLICFCSPELLSAQKLPKVQAKGVRLPSGYKIDGQASEWGDKFEAYNSSTEVFYTLANDDNKLYLLIKATDKLVIRKIIAGSITLTVNSSDNKNGVAIAYPVFDRNNLPGINLRNAPKADQAAIDSFVRVINIKFSDKAKEIKVTGAANLDTLVSVYNEDGINAMARFDNHIAYTYELAIPLKYLGIATSNPKFAYKVSLNGSDHAEGAWIETITGGTRVNGSVPMADMQFMRYPTDFMGFYTLAKK